MILLPQYKQSVEGQQGASEGHMKVVNCVVHSSCLLLGRGLFIRKSIRVMPMVMTASEHIGF